MHPYQGDRYARGGRPVKHVICGCRASLMSVSGVAPGYGLPTRRRRRSGERSALELPQWDLPHRVIRPFLENEVGPVPRGKDVLAKIRLVRLSPDSRGHRLGLRVGEIGIAMEVRLRVLKGR